jgi:hypothetical protein
MQIQLGLFSEKTGSWVACSWCSQSEELLRTSGGGEIFGTSVLPPDSSAGLSHQVVRNYCWKTSVQEADMPAYIISDVKIKDTKAIEIYRTRAAPENDS